MEKKDYNNDTLEPNLVRANSVSTIANILKRTDGDADSLVNYMIKSKTECALKIFDADQEIEFPQYIKDAIEWTYVQQ